MAKFRTYIVQFGTETYTRKTEATYPYATYRRVGAFESPVTFHKTYGAAKRKAGSYGQVKETAER